MNTVLIIVVVLIGGAALFVALSRCCGKAKPAGAGGASEDFVEEANAASKALRHSLAEGLGSPLGGGDRCGQK
jgi:hypothetical protein